MKYRNFLLNFFLIVFLVNFVYSIGVYDSSENFFFYINNDNPTINLSIETPNQIITIDKAELTINNVLGIVDITGTNAVLNPEDNKRDYVFNIEDFTYNDGIGRNRINTSDEVSFKLFAYTMEGSEITPRGDSVKFNIILDKTNPQFISYSPAQITSTNLNLNLLFNEKISSYRFSINNTIVDFNSFSSRYINNYSDLVELVLSPLDLIEGNNLAKIEYTDLAGNSNTTYFNLSYVEVPLNITLNVTNTNYYYNKNYHDFFGNTIYSDSDTFNLKIKTNKPAICYLSNNQAEFTTNFNNIVILDTTSTFSTSNDLNHNISINILDNDYIWIACRNKISSSEIVYLNHFLGMGDNLIKVQKYTGSNLHIDEIVPEGLVTTSPLDLLIYTNERAICRYKKSDASSFLDFSNSSNNYLTHTSSISIPNGNTIFNFECFDVLNNKTTGQTTLNLDPSQGVEITDYSPKVTMNSTQKISFVLSQQDAECRYSKSPIRTSEFNRSTLIPGSGFNRNFTISSLTHGNNNTIYISCKKSSSIIHNPPLIITYDSIGPKLSNLQFTNNGEVSNFVGSENKINFRFNSTSLIPISNYFVEIEKQGNNSFLKNITSNSAEVSTDLKNATKIKIYGKNELGYRSNILEKTIILDITKPMLEFSFDEKGILIICTDFGGSGCSNIYYGLSMVSNCNPTILYNVTSRIDFGENRFICASAKDLAGNEKKNSQNILIRNIIEKDDKINNITTPNNTSNQNNNTNSSDTNGIDYGDDEDEPLIDSGFKNNGTQDTSNSGFNYSIIAAIFIILVATGGGGYYAYKKGYLNKELAKLGLLKKFGNNNNNNNSNSNIARGVNNSELLKKSSNSNNNGVVQSNGQILKSENKSKYENHLDKLNNFIDNEIRKGDKSFDKFNSVDEKDSQLAKDKKDFSNKARKTDIDSEKFDELYSTSKKLKSIAGEDSLEKEAENFEEYYKTRKDVDEEDKKDSK